MGFFDSLLDTLTESFKIRNEQSLGGLSPDTPITTPGFDGSPGITAGQAAQQIGQFPTPVFQSPPTPGDVQQADQEGATAAQAQTQIAAAPGAQAPGTPEEKLEDLIGNIPGLEDALAEAIATSKPGVLQLIADAIGVGVSDDPGRALTEVFQRRESARQNALTRATQLAVSREGTRRAGTIEEKTQRDITKIGAQTESKLDVEAFKFENSVFLKQVDADFDRKKFEFEHGKEAALKRELFDKALLATTENIKLRSMNARALAAMNNSASLQRAQLLEAGRSGRFESLQGERAEEFLISLTLDLQKARIPNADEVAKKYILGQLEPAQVEEVTRYLASKDAQKDLSSRDLDRFRIEAFEKLAFGDGKTIGGRKGIDFTDTVQVGAMLDEISQIDEAFQGFMVDPENPDRVGLQDNRMDEIRARIFSAWDSGVSKESLQAEVRKELANEPSLLAASEFILGLLER
jgi:hypothetical protein